jgi:hypothetical protein
MAFCLNGKGFSRQLIEVLCCIIDKLFGDSLTRVELTEDGNIDSTVSSDTLYVWNNPGATQDMEITLPSASSAGAGTQITCINLDDSHAHSFTVKPNGSDVIYDHNAVVGVWVGIGTDGISMNYVYVTITFISDGAGFWWTAQGPASSWQKV